MGRSIYIGARKNADRKEGVLENPPSDEQEIVGFVTEHDCCEYVRAENSYGYMVDLSKLPEGTTHLVMLSVE